MNFISFFNFLNDSRTDFKLSKWNRWLFNRIINDRTLIKRFQTFDDRWKIKAFDKYFENIYQYLEKILIFFDIIGGGPSCVFELLNIRISNFVNSDIRNVFYKNGFLYFVIFYHKRYTIDESTKIIYRYLSREIDKLLIYYQ